MYNTPKMKMINNRLTTVLATCLAFLLMYKFLVNKEDLINEDVYHFYIFILLNFIYGDYNKIIW